MIIWICERYDQTSQCFSGRICLSNDSTDRPNPTTPTYVSHSLSKFQNTKLFIHICSSHLLITHQWSGVCSRDWGQNGSPNVTHLTKTSHMQEISDYDFHTSLKAITVSFKMTQKLLLYLDSNRSYV